MTRDYIHKRISWIKDIATDTEAVRLEKEILKDEFIKYVADCDDKLYCFLSDKAKLIATVDDINPAL
jgi:hypothetical protein